MAHRRRWAAGVTAVVTLGVGLAGCGSSANGNATSNASAFAKYGAMSAQQRDPKLAKLAAKEGTIKIYTSFQDMDKVAAAFEKKYPGLKVSTYRTDSEAVYAKAQQEDAANRTQADVLETDSAELDDGVASGLITDKYKVDPTNLVPSAVHKGWTDSRLIGMFVSWNTNKVKGADIPTSYQDLENPKFKGQVALEIGDYNWYYGMFQYFKSQGMSDSQVTDMWDKIAANSRGVKGHTDTANLLASGEYSIFADSFYDGILALQEKHAPVTYRDSKGKVSVQPVYTQASGIGILAKAPHSAGAMLFVDFFLGKDGQQIVNDLGNLPVQKGINHSLDGVKTLDGQPPTGALAKTWQDRWAAVLSHAGKG